MEPAGDESGAASVKISGEIKNALHRCVVSGFSRTVTVRSA